MSRRKQQIAEWLENHPEDDAWLTMTLQEIADEISTDEDRIVMTTVRDLLPLAVADKLGIEPSEVVAQRREHRREMQGFASPLNISMIKEWRTQEIPVPIIDIAHRLDLTPNAVKNICKKHDIP